MTSSSRLLHHTASLGRVRPTFLRKNRKVYKRLELESLSDKECKELCRFTLDELRRICSLIKLDNVLRFGSLSVKGVLAFAMVLHRYSFPRRLIDMAKTFGMCFENVSRVVSGLSKALFLKFKYGIEFDERQFSLENCERFAKAIYRKGAIFPNIVGFLDGTMQQTCRPTDAEKQVLVYNGWKHMHCLKYQAISTPDGITSSIFGPYDGSTNDPGMLNRSNLKERLNKHFSMAGSDKRYSIYGDEAYTLSDHITRPFKKPYKHVYEKPANVSMSKVRIAVEMEFGKTVQLFSDTKWKYGNRILQTKPALKYTLASIFKNFHTILNGSAVTSLFRVAPPTLEEYIGGLMRERSVNDLLE